MYAKCPYYLVLYMQSRGTSCGRSRWKSVLPKAFWSTIVAKYLRRRMRGGCGSSRQNCANMRSADKIAVAHTLLSRNGTCVVSLVSSPVFRRSGDSRFLCFSYRFCNLQAFLFCFWQQLARTLTAVYHALHERAGRISVQRK